MTRRICIAYFRMSNPEKTCSRCGLRKPIADFGRRSNSVDGLYPQCRSCVSEKNKSVYKARPARTPIVIDEKECSNCGMVKSAAMFYRLRSASDGLQSWCMSCCRNHGKATWQKRRSDPVYIANVNAATRKSAFKRRLLKHGISLEEYSRLVVLGCGICGSSPEEKGERYKRFSFDHHHATGKFRGLLCFQCNLGIGYLGDDPEIIRKAAAYLESHQQKDDVK